MDDQPEFEEVFAGDSIEANLVRNFLEDSGISAHVTEEFVGTTAPFLTAAAGAGAVKVEVPRAEAPRARELLDSWQHEKISTDPPEA